MRSSAAASARSPACALSLRRVGPAHPGRRRRGRGDRRRVRRAAGRRLLRVRDRHRRLYAVRHRPGRRRRARRRSLVAQTLGAQPYLDRRSSPTPVTATHHYLLYAGIGGALRRRRHRADARGGAGRERRAADRRCPIGRARRSAALLLIPIAWIVAAGAVLRPWRAARRSGAGRVDRVHRAGASRRNRSPRSSRSASGFAAGCSSPRCSSARWSGHLYADGLSVAGHPGAGR